MSRTAKQLGTRLASRPPASWERAEERLAQDYGNYMKTRKCSNTTFKIHSMKRATYWSSHACYVYGQYNCSWTRKGSSAQSVRCGMMRTVQEVWDEWGWSTTSSNYFHLDGWIGG